MREYDSGAASAAELYFSNENNESLNKDTVMRELPSPATEIVCETLFFLSGARSGVHFTSDFTQGKVSAAPCIG